MGALIWTKRRRGEGPMGRVVTFWQGRTEDGHEPARVKLDPDGMYEARLRVRVGFDDKLDVRRFAGLQEATTWCEDSWESFEAAVRLGADAITFRMRSH